MESAAYSKVASVRTEGTAWELLEAVRPLCPYNKFAVVRPSPTAAFEVHAIGAVHPLDARLLQNAVVAFREQALKTRTPPR